MTGAFKFLLLASAATAVGETPSLAQQAVAPVEDSQGANPDAQDSSSTAELERTPGVGEIIVTARRTEERLSDTPAAITAFGSEDLEDREIRDVAALAQFTPGLSFSQAFGRSGDRPVIRGLSNVLAGVQFGAESGASIFLDGALFRGDIQTINFDEIERVEVVKGPQSALYGRNTYSGAINFITKTPGNTFGGSVKARAAQHDEYELTAGLNLPVIQDVLALRVDGRYYEYGGEYRNQLTGKIMGDEQSMSGAITAYFRPSTDVSLRLRAQYSEDDDGPIPFFLLSDNNCRPGFRSARFRRAGTLTSNNDNQYYCGVIEARPDLVKANTDPLPDGRADGTAFDGIEVERFFTTANLDWDIGGSGWAISAIGGYRDETQRFGSDSDFSEAYIAVGAPGSVEPLFANTDIEEYEDYSVEVQLATPVNRPLRALVGVYHYYFDHVGRDITFQSGPKGVPYGTAGAGNDRNTIDNKAVFGRVEADITSQLTVSLEGRYFEEKKTLTEFVASGRVDYPDFRTKDFTPRLTIDWKPDDNTLIYGILAEGNKPGGINGQAGLVLNRPIFRDEKLIGGELGIKKSFLDNRLRASIAVYYNDVTDVQLTTSAPAPGQAGGALTSIATNQGDAEVKGLELELQAAVSDHLRFNATYSYVDAKFTSGCDDFQYTLNTGGLLPTFDTENPPPAALPLCSIAGNRLPLGAPHQWSVSADANYPITPDLNFLANVGFSFEDQKFVQVHNLAKTDTTELLSARVGIAGDRWEVALFGRNLLDETSVPIATRWFDLRYGFATRDIPTAQLTAEGKRADTGLPRAFFAPLRKGRQVGIEMKYRF